jgi:hypothetical protein
MSVLLTNVTNSLVNVPCNGGEKHKYQNIVPGSTVEVSDDYVAGLNPEATARFESVCQGPAPLFSVKVLKAEKTRKSA